MITRLKAVLVAGVDTLHTWRDRKAPQHALSADDIDFFRATCLEWNVEDGFPCSHQDPRQYLAGEGVALKDLWERYKQKAEEASRRVIVV
ncbi:hypothetical protein PC121_g13776 [Phytophthora cactorum]|nr:hypothetical protein PC120_g12227 [Phytophthora cactorum]KAG3059856.1 hypothetical protein PC121_g13776 [Phytophthora cactorum]